MNDGACDVRESDLAQKGTRLHCIQVQPTGAVLARLAIVHGYGEHAGRYLHFMRWLAVHGVASIAIDLRGHGRSAGRRGHIDKWEEYFDDLNELVHAVATPSDTQPAVPWFILGHSHGGLITAAACQRGFLASSDGRFAMLGGCILSSPYLATQVPPPLAKRIFARAANHVVPWLRVRSGLKREWLSTDAGMTAEDVADPLINRSATPRWFFTMRQTQARVREEAPLFKLPLLCLIGESDVIADPAATMAFYERSGSMDKSVYSYPTRVHELIRDVGREQVFADILGWMKARMWHCFKTEQPE